MTSLHQDQWDTLVNSSQPITEALHSPTWIYPIAFSALARPSFAAGEVDGEESYLGLCLAKFDKLPIAWDPIQISHELR